MKRFLMALAMFAVCHSAAAQFTIPSEHIPHIKQSQLANDDILSALESLGLEMYVFTLPIDTLKSYDVTVCLDEYSADTLKSQRKMSLGKTYYRLMNEAGGFQSTFSNRIRVIVNASDADRPKLDFGLVGIAMVSTGVQHSSGMNYGSRPFAEQPFEASLKMPLVMYGSFWQDGGIARFCGSEELDAEMQDEIFRHSPHYYIVSIEMKSD